MIKLLPILKEINPPSPEKIYKNGEKPDEENDEFISKGYRLSKPTIDAETGKVGTEVEYLPEMEKIRFELMKYRKEFQPFKFSTNKDIAGLAKNINTSLTKLGQMIYALDKLIDLNK